MGTLGELGKKIRRARRIGFAKRLSIMVGRAKSRLNILPGVPPTVYVELTDICNLDCVMCDRAGMSRKNGLMSMELFKKIIDNAVEIGVPSIKLNRFGESLIHPQLMEMIRYAKDKGVPWVYFTSNATLVTKEKAEALINSGLDSITFSFDGATKKTYEGIRVKANYEEVRDNIENFIRMRNEKGQESPRVVINTILSNDTADEIYDVIEYWAPKADKVNILPVGKYGNIEHLSSMKREGLNRIRPCHHVFDRLMIFWDGVATVCCGDINGTLSIGNFKDSRIEELWKSAKFEEIRRKHRSRDLSTLPVCLKCDASDAVHFDKIQAQRRLVQEKAIKMGFRHKLKF